MGLSIPLHPFIHDIITYYDIAPLQMTPNAYRMAMCMYVLYDQLFEKKMSARELGFFYQLKQTGKNSGFFYLSAWNVHDGQCIKRNKKGMSDWLPQFLYCYDCPTYRTEFNRNPQIPSKTALKGHSLERALEALKLSTELGDGASLLTDQNLRRCGFLPNKKSLNLVSTEDSEAETSNMASGVPSFVNKSASYDDLFGDEGKDLVLIDATPISRMKSTLASQDKSATSSKRKLPVPAAIDSAKGPGSRFKKSKPSPPGTPSEGSNPLIRKFSAMVGNQIPEEVIAEWDKMSSYEAVKATTWCEAQSLFHILKQNEEMMVVARGDQKLSDEVKYLKSLLKTSEDEKKKLADASKKLKASEAKLLKEREQLNTSIVNLDTEKDALQASYTRKVGEFKKKLDSLNTTIALERSTREAAKREKFEAFLLAAKIQPSRRNLWSLRPFLLLSPSLHLFRFFLQGIYPFTNVLEMIENILVRNLAMRTCSTAFFIVSWCLRFSGILRHLFSLKISNGVPLLLAPLML
ncbi:hypothetical protein POM88_002288 [Heracleum sosnowskyi]|uniref:Transposase (putative) gypsy type domain-containing protein n=1 Tax=Heracleum sosnowskyi TaxID=360622 RepID=A0AAD8JF84_9APIA|nr:hypothetical protein POM88_002288 [Heracleum sosnowskyi]